MKQQTLGYTLSLHFTQNLMPCSFTHFPNKNLAQNKTYTVSGQIFFFLHCNVPKHPTRYELNLRPFMQVLTGLLHPYLQREGHLEDVIVLTAFHSSFPQLTCIFLLNCRSFIIHLLIYAFLR